VGLCGELGADPDAIPVLLGLGVDELSMSAPAIPAVKRRLRELTWPEARDLATRVLALGTTAEVRQACRAAATAGGA